MNSSLLHQNSVSVGLVATLLPLLLTAAVIYAVLTLLGYPVVAYYKFFALAFIPPAFILRYYARRKDQPRVTKTIIITLFFSFLLFFFFLLRLNPVVAA